MSNPYAPKAKSPKKKNRWSKKGRDTRTIEQLTEAERGDLSQATSLSSDDREIAELAEAARRERAERMREPEAPEMPEVVVVEEEDPEPEEQQQLEAEFAAATSMIDQLESRLGTLEQQRRNHATPEPEPEPLRNKAPFGRSLSLLPRFPQKQAHFGRFGLTSAANSTEINSGARVVAGRDRAAADAFRQLHRRV